MKRIPSFAAGMLTMALIGSLGVGALAATGSFTITVDPINVQVNGEVFQPKDATGADVPVFSYNGTTYAPLRALAEAYGLEVGYDAASNMATVTGDVAAAGTTTTPAPDTATLNDYSDWSAEEEAAYQEFKGMWEIEVGAFDPEYKIQHIEAKQISGQNMTTELLKANSSFAKRLAREYFDGNTQMAFTYHPYEGSVFQCGFQYENGSWITW